MWIAMSEVFLEEAKRYQLAFTCEACAYFCDQREECAIQYPTTEHRQAHVDNLQNGEPVRFCKMFEAR